MTTLVRCGYDGSDSSREAVIWAAEEAKRLEATLNIVSCYEIALSGAVGGPWVATGGYEAMLEATSQGAEAMRAWVAEHYPSLKIDMVVSSGPASVTLVEGLGPKDRLVIGSSRHAGATSFLGNTARVVARRSPCPVIVVRGASSRGCPDRVVVGVDGSATSDAALLWAGDEADLLGVPLVVVHNWHYAYVSEEFSSTQARDLTRIDAACVLERSVEMVRDRCGVDVLAELHESTASGLLSDVRDGDLLVLGASGRGALAAAVLGSTVNSVLDRAVVPVVVVPLPVETATS